MRFLSAKWALCALSFVFLNNTLTAALTEQVELGRCQLSYFSSEDLHVLRESACPELSEYAQRYNHLIDKTNKALAEPLLAERRIPLLIEITSFYPYWNLLYTTLNTRLAYILHFRSLPEHGSLTEDFIYNPHLFPDPLIWHVVKTNTDTANDLLCLLCSVSRHQIPE